MPNFFNLPPFADNGDVHVVVETPRGSRAKFAYDPTLECFALRKSLLTGLSYPHDWGFVPSTKADDGDPLDALVLVTNPTYPGILIECRPIGLLRLKDQGSSDDKIICVSINDPRYMNTKDVTDMEEHHLKEMAHFFQVYKDLEGKKVEVLGWDSAEKAKTVIIDAVKNYKKILSKY